MIYKYAIYRNSQSLSLLIFEKLLSQMAEEEMEQCDNCLKMFPQSKIATHFGYCRRNIKRCDKCGEMYDINSVDEHQEQFHKQVACQYCNMQFSPADIASHTNSCAKKPKFCEYCEQKVPSTQFNSHLKICESRTKMCDKCRQPISNKDFLIHLTTCQGIVQVEEKPAKNYGQYIQANRNQEQKLQYARMDYGFKPYEDKNEMYEYKRKNYGEQRKGNLYEKKESLSKYAMDKKDYALGSGMERKNVPIKREQSGSNRNIPAKVKTTNQPVKTSGVRNLPSNPPNNPPSNPIGQVRASSKNRVNQIGRVNTRQYKPPSYNREENKILSSNNIPTYNQPKISSVKNNGGIGQGSSTTKYTGKSSSSNSYSQKGPSSNQYGLQNKRQYPKQEPPKKQKAWKPEDYGGYIEDDVADLRGYEQQIRPNIGNNYFEEPPATQDYLQNQDAELQKAIMMSMGQKKKPAPKNIPKQLDNQDLMNQSFYNDMDIQKQKAIYEQAQRNKRRY